jgi:hypothetical protein
LPPPCFEFTSSTKLSEAQLDQRALLDAEIARGVNDDGFHGFLLGNIETEFPATATKRR